MATSNEDILSRLTRHQMDLIRFAKGFASRLVRILNRNEPELRALVRDLSSRVGQRGLVPSKTASERIRKIETRYREVAAVTWKDVRASARDELGELAALEVDFTDQIIVGALPVVFEPTLPDAAAIRTILARTPINGQPLEAWLMNWQVNDRTRAMTQIRQGLAFGETPLQISRRVFGTRALSGADGIRETTRRGALVFAQTAVSAITNSVKQELYEMNRDVIHEHLYVATLDSRTSPICQSLDGRIDPVGEGPIPPVHINCRSVRVPIIDGQVIGTRAADTTTERRLRGLRGKERRAAVEELVGQVPAKTTYAEFLRSQNAAFQDEVLGPARGKLFRRGDVSLDQFVDFTGKQFTLDELRQRIPSAFTRANL